MLTVGEALNLGLGMIVGEQNRGLRIWDLYSLLNFVVNQKLIFKKVSIRKKISKIDYITNKE